MALTKRKDERSCRAHPFVAYLLCAVQREGVQEGADDRHSYHEDGSRFEKRLSESAHMRT